MYLQNDVIGIVLAGGRGNRLLPLTAVRAKPCVPFGGEWIIADLALWSLYNSGIRTIKVLAQYISRPLIQHVQKSWPLHPYGEPHMEVVPAQMRVHEDWYRGTADAVYQNLDLICEESKRFSIAAIFASDHVFKIDVTQLREFHDAKHSQFTVCVKEMPTGDVAGKFGVLIVDENERIIGFEEKPEKPKGIPGRPGQCYASMGNYLADSALLKEVLEKDARDESSSHDFGNNVIPELIRSGVPIFAYNFAQNIVPGQKEPYWVDVGTIGSYWGANMDLVGPWPALNLYSEEWPVLPYPDGLPPVKVARGENHEYMLAGGGCIIDRANICKSVLGRKVHVFQGANIEGSILFSGVTVGANVHLKKVIVDEGNHIPDGTRIGYSKEEDKARKLEIKDGITIVPYKFFFTKK